MSLTTEQDFVESLVHRVPRLESLLKEHLDDNFGELLPNVFLGDLTRYVLGLFAAVSARSDATDVEALRQIVGELEVGMATGSSEVKNLIAVSFVENLPQAGEDGARIRSLLGPMLRAELER